MMKSPTKAPKLAAVLLVALLGSAVFLSGWGPDAAVQGPQKDYESIRKAWGRFVQIEIMAVRSNINERYRSSDLDTVIVECGAGGKPAQCNDSSLISKTGKPQMVILLKNVHDTAIEHVEFKLMIRERDGAKKYLYETRYPKYLFERNFPLPPGESGQFTLEIMGASIIDQYYLLTGAYQVEIFPVHIALVDGEKIADKGSGFPRFELSVTSVGKLLALAVFVLSFLISFAVWRKSHPIYRVLLKALLVSLAITVAVVVSAPILILLLHILIGSH